MPLRRPLRLAALAVAAVAAASGLVACSDDGRTLAPAPPTTATTTTVAAAPSSVEALAVRSVDLVDGGTFDRRFTCDGGNEPPTFVLTGAGSAAELAMAVVDLDADGFVHWVVAGLPPGTSTVDPDDLPAGAVEGRSGSGIVGWVGPCPPPGDGPHRYEVRAYALAEPVGLAAGVDGQEAVALLADAAIERATLTATYESTP